MNQPDRANIFNQVKPIPREERDKMLGVRGGVLWFTGLSGSGKSTIARALEHALLRRRRICYVLDGDEIRTRLNRDLGFSPADREENLRRIAEVSRLFSESGAVCITAFISPLKAHRDMARDIIGDDRFAEVFIDASLVECEARDPKGLYKKARAGEIRQFTGIDAPFEAPSHPAIHVVTSTTPPETAVDRIVSYLFDRGMLA